MKKPLHENVWVARACALLFSASLVLAGVAAIVSGDLHYENYWGGRVFGPLAIVFAVLFLVVVLRRDSPPGPKLKGRAARLARKAEETKFPIDDFDKPWTG